MRKLRKEIKFIDTLAFIHFTLSFIKNIKVIIKDGRRSSHNTNTGQRS